MGCDIHLYAEVRKKKSLIDKILFWKSPKWIGIDKWKRNTDFNQENSESEPEFEIERGKSFYSHGRNYNLFCALCGVRRSHFTGNPPIISGPRGLPKDVSERIKAESDRFGSDGHSHNWNTLQELKDFNWDSYGETTKEFLDEVIPKMEAQDVPSSDVRIVYFFDN